MMQAMVSKSELGQILFLLLIAFLNYIFLPLMSMIMVHFCLGI